MYKEDFSSFIKEIIPDFPVDEESLKLILDEFEEKQFLKDEFLVEEGKVSQYYFLAEGFLRVFTNDVSGNEVTTYFYSNRRIVFDAASFYPGIPSKENIQAMTNCKVYAASFDKLNQLFHAVPVFREFGRKIIVNEFIDYKQRTLAMINTSPEDRYLQLMEGNKEIFQYAHLNHIASYLGISERTLNRIRQSFVLK